MEYNIDGAVFPRLELIMARKESVYSEAGRMAWMSEGIKMSTTSRGGLMKGLGRALAGESLFMVNYMCEADQVNIVFTPGAPGQILDLTLDNNQTLICQKDTFLCAEQTVELKMHFRKQLGAGLFGGEGFILQEITGPGIVFLEIPGQVKEHTLVKNEKLLIDPGHIAMFEPTVSYDISVVKGIKNVLFAGEGLFLATLTGPGKIWLETMPLSNLAASLSKYIRPKGK